MPSCLFLDTLFPGTEQLTTITIFNPERCWKCRTARKRPPNQADRCAACGAEQLIGLRIEKPEAFRFVLELLEDRNLVHHAERPQAIPSSFPVHAENWQTAGEVYLETGAKLDEARAVLEARQYALFEEAGPVVDRHDPLCPACGMVMDPAREEACPACAQPVRWIDVPEMDTPPHEVATCRRCGADLSGHQQARRCPECDLPVAGRDAPQRTEPAEEGTHELTAGMGSTIRSTRSVDTLLQIAGAAGIVTILVLLVADVVLGVVALAALVICTLIVKFVRSQSAELQRDQEARRDEFP